MSFMVDPSAPATGGGGGKRRPDVRPGRKLVWCADIEYGKSNAGNDKIDARWCVVDDPEGHGADVRGLFYDTLTLTQRAAWRVQQLAKALGQTAPWDALDGEATWSVLTRRPVWVTLAEETYNGKTRVKVQEFGFYGGEVTEAMEDTINDAEKWCREGKNKRAAAGGGSGAVAQAAGGYAQDEDIPF